MISKNEIEWTEYKKLSGEVVGVITSNQSCNVFYFYEFDGNDFKKLGKGNSPPELECKFRIEERMGVKK